MLLVDRDDSRRAQMAYLLATLAQIIDQSQIKILNAIESKHVSKSKKKSYFALRESLQIEIQEDQQTMAV